MSTATDSASHPALDLIQNERMHREITLPATATHDALNVSYADVGQLPDESSAASVAADHPTILFIPGMFGSRFLGLTLHTIAEKRGVRVLIVDRPGMGRSTSVPLAQRVSVWVELVPYLLQHLGIKYVSLVSHSAGTSYLFNTLHDYRNLLHPDRPFVALLAPWVDPSQSRVTTWQAARLIPTSAFGVWNLLPKFSILQAKPVFAYSGSFFTGISNAVFGSGSQEQRQTENSKRLEVEYGMSPQVQSQLSDLIGKSMFAEDTVGANDEALLCLKKGLGATWRACEDYDVFVKELYGTEQERLASADSNQRGTRLRIRAYFAETDAMSGKKGQEYMTDCFKVESGGLAADAIDFEASTAAGTDHDSIVGMVDVLEKIFVQAGGHLSGSTR